jgi:hypothetical protein
MSQPMNIPKHVIDKKILWARCFLGLFSSMIMNSLICPINHNNHQVNCNPINILWCHIIKIHM